MLACKVGRVDGPEGKAQERLPGEPSPPPWPGWSLKESRTKAVCAGHFGKVAKDNLEMEAKRRSWQPRVSGKYNWGLKQRKPISACRSVLSKYSGPLRSKRDWSHNSLQDCKICGC